MIRLRVECYAGYKGQQRPIRFTLGEAAHEIADVEDQWYSPSAMYFRVIADDGNVYILRHDEVQDDWTLEAYRSPAVHS